jgi:hypothetical protein
LDIVRNVQTGRWKVKRYTTMSLVGVLASLGLVVATGAPASAATTKNLLKNGGAELGTGSPTGAVVPVPDWTDSTGASFTAVKYGATGGGFLKATSPGPTKRGLNFFAGGPNDSNDSIVATQTVNLKPYVNSIKAGHVSATFHGWLGGSGTRTDEAFVELDFKNSKGFLVGTSMTLGPVTESDRGGVTELLERTDAATVPKGARSAFVQLSFSREVGQTYNDAFIDDVGLTLTGV